MQLIDFHEDGAAAKGVSAADPAAAFVRGGDRGIANVTTRLLLLECGGHRFPVSVNDHGENPDNSYVVSPMATYTRYAEFEIRQLERPWLANLLLPLVRGLRSRLEAANIDRIVQVNNWLLSTNLYPPDWEGDEIPALTELLVERFPDHALGFRSLNGFSNAGLLERFEAAGYIPIPSRQVYLFDCRAGEDAPCLRRHNTKLDAALLRNTTYQRITGDELSPEDDPRLEELYTLLYVDKYTPLNPRFSAEWIRRGVEEGWLELAGFRGENGQIDAVVGWFANDTVLTAPVVGYDTALPRKLGLYRLVTRLCLEEAVRRRCVLNFSSGAAHFKRLRGGVPAIESSMVYVGHLPTSRQRVWRSLGRLLRAVGVPLMRRMKL